MMKIDYYKTEAGYLLRSNYGSGFTDLRPYLFNGARPEKTHAPEWYIVECAHSDPIVAEGAEWSKTNILRYERKEESASLPIPEVIIARAEPTGFDAIRDAYTQITEKVEQPRKPLEAEFNYIGQVSWKSLKPEEFKFTLHSVGGWHSSPQEDLTVEDIFGRYEWSRTKIKADDIQKAMTPSLAWHLGPCSIDSATMYRIIRSHVKENLEGTYAEVSSDYDFVFEVKKRLPCKAKEISYSNPFARTKKGRKSYHRLEDIRKVKVLHLTHKGNVHGIEYGAKIVDGMKGENLADLVRQINEFLCDTMALINSPVRICPQCDGSGITDIADEVPHAS